MMVDGAEEGQLKGLIDVLAPYTSLGSPTFPLASRELPMPAEQGLGRDEKATPPPSRERPAERSKDRSVCGSVANATMELPLEHADLVA